MDDLALTRQLVAAAFHHGDDSPEERAATEAVVSEFFEGIREQANGKLVVTQPVKLISEADALAVLRTLRVFACQRQLMTYLAVKQPESGLGKSGAVASINEVVETCLSLMIAYLQTHGELPGGAADPSDRLDLEAGETVETTDARGLFAGLKGPHHA